MSAESTNAPIGGQLKEDKPKLSAEQHQEKKRQKLKRRKETMARRQNKQKRFAGLVTSVTSGDSVNVVPVDAIQGGKLVKPLTITLHGVRAPLLERKYKNEEGQNIHEPDQPFAWESREFLRQKLIGRVVVYRVENSNNNRHYGEIWLPHDDGEEPINIRDEAIRNGLVTVSTVKYLEEIDFVTPESEEYNRIKDLESYASARQLGLHSTNNAKIQASVRHVHHHNFKKDNKKAFELFQKIQRIPQHGVVEQVRSGTSLRIILLDRMDEITVNLAGVSSPIYKDNEPHKADKFGLEAKLFTEYYLLNRDVLVSLESLDGYNNFYATVKLKSKPDFDITMDLLSRGLARLVNWTVSTGAYINDFEDAEKKAKEQQLRIWKNQGLKSSSERESSEFNGTVCEIVNAGTIKVRLNGNDSRKLHLSSIHAPRYHNEKNDFSHLSEQRIAESKKESAFCNESKEFLRRKLIGKQVTCVFDYSYPPEGPGKQYYSVYASDNRNVALDLLEEGLAKVALHSPNQQRSSDYQELVFAQNRAAQMNRGIHGNANPNTEVNDLTKTTGKAAFFFNFMKRRDRVHAVVQYVFNATKFKLYVPKENCYLMFSLAGLKYEYPLKSDNQSARTIEDRFLKTVPENKGIHYSHNKLFQRDVDIKVLDVNDRGLFSGILYMNGSDFATSLLKEGHAILFKSASNTVPQRYQEYLTNENIAKRAKKNMWQRVKIEDESAIKAKKQKERKEANQKAKQVFEITITEIVNGTTFYYQKIDENIPVLEELMGQLHDANLDDAEQYEPDNEELICAKFSADGEYYRATVSRKNNNGSFTVFFVDYGNTEDIPAENIRKLDKEQFGFNELRAQAVKGQLAFIRASPLEEQYGTYAAHVFKELVWNKRLTAKIPFTKQGVKYLTVGDAEDGRVINAALVSAGLATVERTRSKESIVTALQEQESIAKDNKINIWKYGAVADDDSDDRL